MLQFVTTGDGSKTIYNPQVGENYHSKHGALQESRHVFLNAGLKYWLGLTPNPSPKERDLNASATGRDIEGAYVLEVGFGTGLNFLLTADYCTQNNITLNYTGIEAYPLSSEMIALTGCDDYVSADVWQLFNQHYAQSLTSPAKLNEGCRLEIALTKLLDFDTDNRYDVIYFDAFAAIHQPEMWDEQAISHTIKFLKPGGVFVTYAITGNLKRILKSLGLRVEKAPGAPGKREMLRATL